MTLQFCKFVELAERAKSGGRHPAAPGPLSIMVFALCLASTVAADQTTLPRTTEAKPDMWNWTMGGKQFWTDTLIHGDWRLQRHAVSEHYRLLDPANVRRTSGSAEKCLEVWNQLKAQLEIPPLKQKAVLLLHGLGRTRASMKGMATYLARPGDYSVLSFTYASTRCSLEEDARCLDQVVAHLSGVEELHFVAHSMGNLVVRYWLGDHAAVARNRDSTPAIGRFVMLAPPNQGAALAQRFQANPMFRLIFGTGGRQFTGSWESIRQRLVTPSCQFGIIAGGRSDGKGTNPLLSGDDDLVVTVDETRLVGARDFILVPALHTFIMDDEAVQQYTLQFLRHGYFVAEDRRQPITAEN